MKCKSSDSHAPSSGLRSPSSVLPPTADVLKIVDPEDLPASVRNIPAGFDPLAEGILMRHQAVWLADKSDLKLAEKGRRTGITFGEALDDTVTAATRRGDGGDNVFYVGDTKDKGLEFVGYCAHFATVLAKGLQQAVSGIEEVLFPDVQPDGSTKMITSYRIRFASGFRVQALSSSPANIRGLQGIVVIDEAAFHPDVRKVIDACLALLIWGGKVRIISTHNGAKNAFNQLVHDSLSGLQPFRVHHITFDDAVANGLYERVCLMRGWTPSPEAKQAWYEKIRKSYGSNRAAQLEELDAVPREGSGVAIPRVLIERAMTGERPILRLRLDNDFTGKGLRWRDSWITGWIAKHLDPLLDSLDPYREHVFGEDYGRYADLAVFAPMSIEQDLVRRVPFIIELSNVPTRHQRQILWRMIDRLPRYRHGAMDATGNGFGLAEDTVDRYGEEAVSAIKLNDAWYRENMVSFQGAFTDDMIDLPRDADIANDIGALEQIDGIVKLPRIHEKDTKDSTILRHGDSAIALALGWYASRQEGVDRFGYTPVTSGEAQDLDRPVRITAGFRAQHGMW